MMKMLHRSHSPPSEEFPELGRILRKLLAVEVVAEDGRDQTKKQSTTAYRAWADQLSHRHFGFWRNSVGRKTRPDECRTWLRTSK